MFTRRESNFCKGFAIILMLFHHLFNDFEEYAGYTVDYRPFTSERIYFYAFSAKLCVAVFVFISGYGIAATWHRQFGEADSVSAGDIGRFIRYRWLKLMAGYWFVFALTLLCQPLGRTIFDAYGTELKDIAVYLLIDFFGLAHMFGTPTLNPTWWYMSIAFTIIILMPFVMELSRKFSASLVLVGGVVILFLAGGSNPNTLYLFSMLLGAFCHEIRLFDRAFAIWEGKRWGLPCKFLIEVFFLLLLLACRTEYNYYGIADGLISMTLAAMTMTVFIRLPVISPCMQLLGKNSANMYLIHNQLYSFYFLGFFYSFRHWLLILAVLTVVSLAASIAIEWLKDKIGYQRKMTEILFQNADYDTI